MSLLITIAVIGGIIGWLASILMKNDARTEMVANVTVGVVGSLVGVAIAGELGMNVHDAPAGWIIAAIGAALLVVVLRALRTVSRLPARGW